MDDKPKFAEYDSTYESLKREIEGQVNEDRDDTQVPPTTPGAKSRIPDVSMTPTSSPFDPTSYLVQSTRKIGAENKDPLLHRVLDKNYRVQATPHTARKNNKTPANKPSWRDITSPMSSPPAAAPQLHADIFSSPIRREYSKPICAPRTPGICVQTPAKGKATESALKRPDPIFIASIQAASNSW
jgi:DASH complex subunit ASK1